jgi:hypothetical protein
VRVLTTSIADLERGLLPLARTYAGSLDRQTRQLAAEQGAVEARLAALPGQAESGLRLQRDVKRLSQVVLGLQAQMIDTRLAALGEGGQVRQVDVAAAPKRPLFPRAVHTLPGGLLLGLVGGAVWAIGRGAWSSRVRSTADAERASGVVAVALRPGAPLLLGAADAGTVVVVGAGGGEPTRPVAEALAAEARARGRSATVVGGVAAARTARRSAPSSSARRPRTTRCTSTGRRSTTPGVAAVLDRHRAVAVVAAEGVTTRGALAAAADTLGRLGVPVLGVVVAPRARR